MRAVKRRLPLQVLLWFLVFIITFAVLEARYHVAPTLGGEQLDTISQVDESSLKILFDLTTLVGSFCILIYGAIGILASGKERGLRHATTGAFIFLSLSFSLATASLWFSALIYKNIFEMLSNGFLRLDADCVRSPLRWQLLTAILSAVALGGGTALCMRRNGKD